MRLLAGCVLAVCAASAQPVVSAGGVRNSASYTPPGHLNSGLARGALIVIFGQNLGPEALVQAAYPLPTELGGTSVRISAGGTLVDAPMVYAVASQLAVVLPSNTPLGVAQLTVRNNGQTSRPVDINVVQRNFGIYTQNARGAGPAVVQNFEPDTSQPLNTLLAPARPGQVVTLWGTGLGPVDGPEAERPLPADMDIPIAVRVGFRAAKVLYKGRSGCCPGVDEIVFEVPAGVEGCYAPVVVVAGNANRQAVNLPMEGAVSNTGTLAIAGSGRCTDPTGLTGAELELLAGTGGLRAGVIEVESYTAGLAAARATFSHLELGSALRSLNVFGLPAPGTCLEVEVADSLDAPRIPSPLDAGPLTLAGPRGAISFTRPSPGAYTLSIAQALQGTGYSVDNGDGTASVGPFRVAFAMPNPVTWTNKSTVLGTSEHTFRWSGGDPDAFVVISGLLTTNAAAFGSVCVERAGAGQFTLPAPEWNAGLLEGGTWGRLSISVSVGTVGQPVRFSASGLDLGVLLPRVIDQRSY